MATYPSKVVSVASLELDYKNPRLLQEAQFDSPRELINYLFEHYKVMDVAESIATRGYFPNEPLLVVTENSKPIVVEGNRRLAALKALRDPGLLDGPAGRRVSQLYKQMEDPLSITSVPVVLLPNRRATDRLVAGRHVGTPVLPWRGENRARFILGKIAEGYDNFALTHHLGFSPAQVQKARQTKAIVDMTRALPFSPEVRARLEKPRTAIFTTIERIVESSTGREFLGIKADAEHGLIGEVKKDEFVKALSKIVVDIVSGRQTSRSLNKKEDMEKYFGTWSDAERPNKTQPGYFTPQDFVTPRSSIPTPVAKVLPTKPKAKADFKTVLPKSFKVVTGEPRLIDIRSELVNLPRDKYPNAGAMLLRAFFELAAVDFLKRRGMYDSLVEKPKNGKDYRGTPNLKSLVPALIKIAQAELTKKEADLVQKAIQYNDAAPFTVSDLHSFVHQITDMPSSRDIRQFWMRTEPLFKLMLEKVL